MRISQSSLNLQGQSASYVRHYVEESLQFSFQAAQASPPTAETSQVIISDAARDTLAAAQSSSEVTPETDKQNAMDARLQVLISLVEQLTGHKIKLFDVSELGASADAGPAQTEDAPTSGAGAPPQPEWSLHFERREVREEAQATRFQASGNVKTADGREISFDLDLEMARFARSESLTTVDAGNVRRKDPLVLNLQGGPTSLLSERLAFDLDANPDTAPDMIAKLGQGSFFLALDRNGNGKIDDGSELFGPATGDGFGELAALDDDGNGWIDEADSAFTKLGVWAPGDKLQSLASTGVGAIALQNVATPFALRAGSDDHGEIQSSGIFLTEDGRPGTIQHVDLTV
ncbi:VCBS repeat-containing protein [Uliginosibacterium sp. H3]|uniref:VCBS repeat-containing protein n=1 Tax=Uliginosibacterium silvisoli TaxID=3114758 RepID=A0ABU6KAP4_9RHOO|nr:VCBS repeat-containing protein [Uliginosibacterium sp. H3]